MTWAERVMESWETTKIDRATMTDGQKSLVAWLSRRDFNVFWTQTFRGRVSADGAQASWLRCLAECNRRSTVKAAMWAVEPHANYPSHHVHALLSMRLRTLWTNWRSVYQPWKEHLWRSVGKALILPTRPTTSCWYVVKYVNKSPTVHWQQGTPKNLWGILTSREIQSLIPETSMGPHEYNERLTIEGRKH